MFSNCASLREVVRHCIHFLDNQTDFRSPHHFRKSQSLHSLKSLPKPLRSDRAPQPQPPLCARPTDRLWIAPSIKSPGSRNGTTPGSPDGRPAPPSWSQTPLLLPHDSSDLSSSRVRIGHLDDVEAVGAVKFAQWPKRRVISAGLPPAGSRHRP
jgi:hypothetical protein